MRNATTTEDRDTVRGQQQPDDPEGVPSAVARQRLQARLRTEIADLRTRLDETAMRAEAHRLLGDDAAAARVLSEQSRLAEQLRRALDRALGEALVEREAEAVVAAATTRHDTYGVPQATAPALGGSRRAGVLVGALSLVTALVLGATALQGPSDPSQLEVAGAVGGPRDQGTAGPDRSESTVPASEDRAGTDGGGPVVAAPPASATGGEVDTSPGAAGTSAPSQAGQAPGTPAASGPDASTESTPPEDPSSSLGQIIDEILDGVAGGGDDEGDEDPDDGESEPEDLVPDDPPTDDESPDEALPSDPPTDGGGLDVVSDPTDDGFVPEGAGQ